MAKRKFYAVRPPVGPAVFETWDECRAAVEGVSGASFKSFASRADAEAWASGGAAAEPPDGKLLLYVDGSFVPGCPYAGWGIVAVENGEILWTASGRTALPAESRNVDGELEAATRAILWLKHNPRPAEIRHDYEGVARWALGDWKAKSAVAKRYAAAVLPLPEGLTFAHVTAHAGEKWNEAVDALARSGVAPSSADAPSSGNAAAK